MIENAFDLMVWERIFCAILSSKGVSDDLDTEAKLADEAFKQWKCRERQMTDFRKAK